MLFSDTDIRIIYLKMCYSHQNEIKKFNYHFTHICDTKYYCKMLMQFLTVIVELCNVVSQFEGLNMAYTLAQGIFDVFWHTPRRFPLSNFAFLMFRTQTLTPAHSKPNYTYIFLPRNISINNIHKQQFISAELFVCLPRRLCTSKFLYLFVFDQQSPAIENWN